MICYKNSDRAGWLDWKRIWSCAKLPWGRIISAPSQTLAQCEAQSLCCKSSPVRPSQRQVLPLPSGIAASSGPVCVELWRSVQHRDQRRLRVDFDEDLVAGEDLDGFLKLREAPVQLRASGANAKAVGPYWERQQLTHQCPVSWRQNTNRGWKSGTEMYVNQSLV